MPSKYLGLIKNKDEFFKEFDNRWWIELLEKVAVRSNFLRFRLKNSFWHSAFLMKLAVDIRTHLYYYTFISLHFFIVYFLRSEQRSIGFALSSLDDCGLR